MVFHGVMVTVGLIYFGSAVHRANPPLRHCEACGRPFRRWAGIYCGSRACKQQRAAERPAESLRDFRRRLRGDDAA